MIRAARQLWHLVIVRPLTYGRLEPRHWAPSQQVLGWFVAVMVGLSLIAVVAADWLRMSSTPVYDSDFNLSLPGPAIPFLLVGAWLALTLLHTAALHGTWLLRLPALIVLALGLRLSYGATQGTVWLWVCLGSLAVILLMHVIRAGRQFANWEPLVIGVAMAWYLGAPLQRGALGVSLGSDSRIPLITSNLMLVLTLATPPLVAAGAALAQVAAQAGLAAAEVATRVRSATTFQLILLVVLGVQGINALWRLTLLPANQVGAALSWTALSLSLTGALVWCFMRLAERPSDPPESVLEPFATVSFAVITGVTGLSMVRLVADAVADLLGPQGQWVRSVATFARTPTVTSIFRATVAGVAMLVGLKLARRRGVWHVGAIASAIAVPSVLRVVGSALGTRAGLPDQAVTFWLTVALALALGWVVYTRSLTPVTGRALLGAAVVLLFYDVRGLLAEPLTMLVGFSALATLVVGLTWRLLTDGEFTREESARLPRSTRVLLYLANATFAATVVVVGALSKDVRGWFDLSMFEDIGNQTYSPALLATVVLVALHHAVTARQLTTAGQIRGPGSV